MIYDAIITGAGPAGSTAAYHLSKSGLNVLLLDKYKFPRYKACGGFISKKILRIVDFDFSEVIEKETSCCGLTYKSANGFTISMEEPLGYLVSRDAFDRFLAEKAVSRGARFHDGEKVTGFENKNDIYEVTTDKAVYRSKYIIGADGANSVIRKKSKLAQKIKRFLTLTAELPLTRELLSRVENTAWFDLGDIPYGYGWIFPKTNHITVGIGLFYDSRRKQKKDPRIYLHQLQQKNKLLSGFPIQSVSGHFISTLTDERSCLSNKGIFLTGEAAGFVDPFSGEGIYYAVLSSKLLSEQIINNFNNPDAAGLNYKNLICENILKEFKVAEKLGKVIYTFPKLSFQILHDYRHLAQYYYQLLSGNVPYHDLYGRLIDKVKKKVKNKLGGIFSFAGKN